VIVLANKDVLFCWQG